MNAEEFAAWRRFMEESRGHWTVDPIHNGIDRDLIVFRGSTEEEGSGVYVMIEGAKASAGRYAEALESVTSGVFTPFWEQEFESENAAYARVIERLGMPFLLGLTHGRSPYREN